MPCIARMLRLHCIAISTKSARILLVSLLSLAAASFLDVRPAQAISQNNPYRSFNISGYNYGSTQWQKSHVGNSWSSQRTRGVFLRRR